MENTTKSLLATIFGTTKFWIETIMTVVGLVGFVRPDWLPYLNWPTVEKYIPHWGWLILTIFGIILMLITVTQKSKNERVN